MRILHKIRTNLGVAKRIASKLGRSFWQKIYIMCDVIYCKMCMHCTFEEYQIYEFYKYKNLYRRDFILQHHRNIDYSMINPYHFTMHKKEIYKLIQRGIHRELLYLPEAGEEQFLAFVKKHKRVITKPDVGSCGKDIQAFEYSNDEQALAFFYSLKEESVCEEYIKQHEKMGTLNPSSVNSVRIVTLCRNGTVTFVSASLKSGGQKDTIVDNMHSKGVGANVDMDTGVVTGLGYDYHEHSYIYHPVTGTQIVGFSIPFWSETIELVKRTHLDVPQCPMLGWDVAITDNGPEIIEINGAPGPKLMQLMDQKPKRHYLRKYIKEYRVDNNKK